MFGYTIKDVEGENFAKIAVTIVLSIADETHEIMYFRTHKEGFAHYIGEAIVDKLERDLKA